MTSRRTHVSLIRGKDDGSICSPFSSPFFFSPHEMSVRLADAMLAYRFLGCFEAQLQVGRWIAVCKIPVVQTSIRKREEGILFFYFFRGWQVDYHPLQFSPQFRSKKVFLAAEFDIDSISSSHDLFCNAVHRHDHW